MPLEKMNVETFLKRICDPEGKINLPRLTFFLGAGCSISSGIQGAAGLARMWWETLDAFQQRQIPSYSDDKAGQFYNRIVEVKFGRNERAKQKEIARIMAHARPGFGYCALAKMIEKSRSWSCRDGAPIVLTTNFDDLLERAFLIHTSVVPVVVGHDSLINYSTPSDCIIKLHGDFRFSPCTDSFSTQKLKPNVQRHLGGLIRNTDLVFIGYSGGDPSIAKLVRQCLENNDVENIYWINQNPPNPILVKSLEKTTAYHIDSVNFDDLMAVMLKFTGIQHPSVHRLLDHIDRYHEFFFGNMLRQQSGSAPPPSSGPERKFHDWFGVVQNAMQYVKSDWPKVDSIFQKGISRYCHNPSLSTYYAHVIFDFGNDIDKSNHYYKRALRIDKDHGRANAMYAAFLVHNPNYCRSMTPDKFFLQAIKADPMDLNSMINLTGYLFQAGRDQEAVNYLQESRRRALSDMNCLEADFYELAYQYDAGRAPILLRRIRANLQKGVRPYNYEFIPGAQVALTRNSMKPPTDLILDLARVMEGADLQILDVHNDYKDA